ncbi:hypothetical protein LUX03_16835 [Streptomyces sudanensis]|nr:hypothetical protein [Streptomyces sudanensis]MCP9958970.1 hypothetical protein [Streptomyces sudanensis]
MQEPHVADDEIMRCQGDSDLVLLVLERGVIGRKPVDLLGVRGGRTECSRWRRLCDPGITRRHPLSVLEPAGYVSTEIWGGMSAKDSSSFHAHQSWCHHSLGERGGFEIR